jgi:Mrp family chromosome partitioning ATPase
VSGTGKTSLTLALGVSFAAADSRTLLIDCDLVGGGLTSRANAIVKRKIGRVLQREGLLTDEQLEEAMRLASGSRRRLGEILVELGHLKAEELDSALVAQQKGSVGLLDAINGEALSECVAATGIQGLSVLPLGGARAQHASKVTPAALRRVLAEARKHYDTILIDTGPAPGSLEASVVAAEVDGVILCVSRGEQRPLAEQCVAHLQSVGARVAGVVFNRAETTDVSGVYGKSSGRGSAPAVGGVPARGTAAESARFGPMAQAVTYGSGGDAGEKNT